MGASKARRNPPAFQGPWLGLLWPRGGGESAWAAIAANLHRPWGLGSAPEMARVQRPVSPPSAAGHGCPGEAHCSPRGSPHVWSPTRLASLGSQHCVAPRGPAHRGSLSFCQGGSSVSPCSLSVQAGGLLSDGFHGSASPQPPSLGKPPGFALKDQVAVKVLPCTRQPAGLWLVLCRKAWPPRLPGLHRELWPGLATAGGASEKQPDGITAQRTVGWRRS